MKKKKLTHSFNVLFSAEDMDRLTKLSEFSSTNMSIVLRQALKWRYMQELENVPTCAHGRACFVPHMHVQPAPTPQGATP